MRDQPRVRESGAMLNSEVVKCRQSVELCVTAPSVVSAIMASAIRDNVEEGDVLTPASFVRLYRCTGRLIGRDAESVLWQRAIALSLAETNRHSRNKSVSVLLVADNSPSCLVRKFEAALFVRMYVEELYKLIGTRLTLHYFGRYFRAFVNPPTVPTTLQAKLSGSSSTDPQ